MSLGIIKHLSSILLLGFTFSGGYAAAAIISGEIIYAASILTSDYAGSTTNTGFVFVTNNVQRMVLDNNGNLGLGIASPGAYRFYANGPSFFAGDLTLSGKLFVDTIVNRTVTNISVSGGILPDSAAPLSVRNLGSNGTRWNNLFLSGQITIGGGSPGVNKVLTSDANGLATWTSTSALIAPNLDWSLSGNAIGASDFLGTTNDRDLILKRNNVTVADFSTGGNLALGQAALSSNTTGTDNVAIGSGAMRMNTTGVGNTANGVYTLFSNTDGYMNTANGAYALNLNTTGSENVAIGGYALTNNTIGGSNTAVGALALFANTTGKQNTGNGYSSLGNNTAGSQNVANGDNALSSNIIGSGNVAIGLQALYSSTGTSFQTAVGYQALRNSTSGFWNTAIGSFALTANTRGSSNTSLGYNTLSSNLTGSLNVALGTNALAANTSGNGNHALGTTALANNTTGSDNTAVGNNTLYASLTGAQNVSVGSNAGLLLKSGDKNILIGNGAGFGSTGAYYSENTIVGHSAGFSLFTGSYNTLMGFRAGTDISGGANNTLIGYSAGRNITNGSNHIALGYQALERNVGSSNPLFLPNIAIGYEALRGGAIVANNNTAYDNVAIGYQALRGTIATASTGYQNLAIGNGSLALLTTGIRNTVLGNQAGASITTGSNNILIGFGANPTSVGASNELNIGNWIYGSGGNIGIGISNPSETLTVSGNVLANGYLYTSDERLKSNISTLTDVDTILSSLRGVSFQWKSNNRKDIGFIAQEVETILPELVHTDASGMKSVQYGNIIAILVEGYKTEKARADSLAEKIQFLEKRLDRIESTNQ